MVRIAFLIRLQGHTKNPVTLGTMAKGALKCILGNFFINLIKKNSI